MQLWWQQRLSLLWEWLCPASTRMDGPDAMVDLDLTDEQHAAIQTRREREEAE